jgi:hypothetical protein
MKGTLLTARWNTVMSSVLGLVIAIFVIAVWTGINAPFVSGEKSNFIILAVLGIFLCVKGNSHSAMMYGWTNPLYWKNSISIIGMVLGAFALLLIAFTIVGINIPLIDGYRMSFRVLAIIIFLKFGLKIIQNRKKIAQGLES